MFWKYFLEYMMKSNFFTIEWTNKQSKYGRTLATVKLRYVSSFLRHWAVAGSLVRLAASWAQRYILSILWWSILCDWLVRSRLIEVFWLISEKCIRLDLLWLNVPTQVSTSTCTSYFENGGGGVLENGDYWTLRFFD